MPDEINAETHLEAFIAANSSGGSLKKIELSELTFLQFANYYAVYADMFKNRTAFIDNVFLTFNNNTAQAFTEYDDVTDRLLFEYSSMSLGTVENLNYGFAEARKTDAGYSMNYVVAYSHGAFAEADELALLNAVSTISCDIYVIE